MKKTNETVQVFDIWASKAPVNIPGPQMRAHKLRKVVWPVLLEKERTRLEIALGHALDVGEGRKEFDLICKEIRTRLQGK